MSIGKRTGADVRATYSADILLHVEGTETSIDKIILTSLLPNVDVLPLQGCRNITSLNALNHPALSHFYYLIDRDYLPEETVNKYWDNFGKEKGHLLVWRKRHIESYLLNPKCLYEYLNTQTSLDITQEKIEGLLISSAEDNFFYEVACFVINEVNHSFRTKRLPFPNQKSIKSENDILEFFDSVDFTDRKDEINNILNQSHLSDLMQDKISLFKEESAHLSFDSGKWLDYFDAKNMLNQVLFELYDDHDKVRKTIRYYTEHLADLIGKEVNPEWLPEDFRKLRELFSNIH